MATLPTSLRRTMFVLLGFTTFIIVMVFYWNQNASHSSPSMSLMNTFFIPVDRHTPLEKSWTYKCDTDRCVRDHYMSDQKRVPFMNCAMTCGSLNIWPKPTIKASVSSRALSFTSDDIQFDVKTEFSESKKLITDAYDIFLFDLKKLEGKAVTNGVTVETKNDKMNEVRSKVADAEDIIDNRHCDIRKFLIYVEILNSADTHIHMNVDESYELSLNHTSDIMRANIRAPSFFGARHGLTTLQQLMWFDDEDNVMRVLSAAHIKDKPKFNFRGLMLDTSRNYFSVDTIKRMLVGMSHSKLNRFHWHITDSQSFPFASKAYPQMAQYGAYSSKEIYTVEDVKNIAEYARVRGIQVLPEIDAPAHSGNGWDWGPKHGLGDLSLCVNQQPWTSYCGEPPCGQLNPRNNNTYKILEKIYGELLEATGPSDFFHIGGDEVNLECWSQFFNDTELRSLWCEFMLQAYQRLKAANKNIAPKIVAVWSSGLTSTQCLSSKDFAVQLWGGSDWQENYAILQSGFNVIISHVDAWYFDCGFGSWRTTGEGACSPYTTWQRVYRHRPWDRMRLDPQRMKQILGGEACLWTEQVDEGNVDARLWPRSAALAERLWTDPSDLTESDIMPKEIFRRLSIFRNRLLQFGIEAEPMFPKYCAQNQDECA